MDALGSPMIAAAIVPDLSTISGFTPKKGRIPDDNVCKLSELDRADVCRNALRYRRVDRVFRDVTPSSEIIIFAALFGQSSKLLSHFIGSLPRADDHLANAPHCLAVR